MGEVFKQRQFNSKYGIFFQATVFLSALLGLCNLFQIFYYSFTEFNMIEKPSFVGFENYIKIFKESVVTTSLLNTVVMVLVVAFLLLLFAVLPAIFIARLKLPFGLAVMAIFWLTNIFVLKTNFLNLFLSGDSYGIVNSFLLSKSIITEPIAFAQVHPMLIAVALLWVYGLAPVFSITYVAARMKHSFLGSAIAVCLVPVVMCGNATRVMSVIGYPSSADWLYTILNDYLTVRFDVGFAYAILVIGLIMLTFWCAIVCAVIVGLWAIFRKINSNSIVHRVFGYISFSVSLMLFFVILVCAVRYLLTSLKPIEELLIFPNNKLLPLRPTLKNFQDLFKFSSSVWVPYWRYILNSLCIIPLIIMPFCLVIAIPSGIGFSAFNFKGKKLLLICFIPFLFISSYMGISKLGLVDTYFSYALEFLSSFELLTAIFLVYLTVKLVFYDKKLHIFSVLLGVFFIISSFYAIGAIRGIHTVNNAVYNEQLKTWYQLSSIFSSGGIARSGIAAANDMLMLLATVAVVIVPLILLLIIYLLYRKNTKDML